MNYTIIKGDLTKAIEDFIIHQVNCKGIMGSGVALAIRNEFPMVYREYIEMCKPYKYSNTQQLLGRVQYVQVYNQDNIKAPFYCINMFSQDGIGYNRQHTDISAMQNCLLDININCKERTVAFPWKVGCVRGGADWDKVLPLITNTLTDVKAIVLYNI